MNDGRNIKVHKDSSITIAYSQVGYYERHPRVAYDSVKGCRDFKEGEHYLRLVLTEDIPSLRLKAGSNYFVKVIDCFRDIPARSTESTIPFTPTRSHMGFEPSFRPPYSIGHNYNNLDYSRRTSGNNSHHTRLLRIDYVNGQRAKDVYLPCHPDSLIWHFVRREHPQDEWSEP